MNQRIIQAFNEMQIALDNRRVALLAESSRLGEAGAGAAMFELDYFENMKTIANWGKVSLQASAGNMGELHADHSPSVTEDVSRETVMQALESGHVLVTGQQSGLVGVWHPATGKLLAANKAHNTEVCSVNCVTSPDKTETAATTNLCVLSASQDRVTLLWDVFQNQEIKFRGHHSKVISACSLNGGRTMRVATSSLARDIKIWDGHNGACIATLKTDSQWVFCLVQLGLGGNLLAGCCESGEIKIWDADTGVIQKTFEGHKGQARAICTLDSTGNFIASGGTDCAVFVWNVHQSSLAVHCLGHRDWVTALCCWPEGSNTIIASGSCDRTLRLWRLGQLTGDNVSGEMKNCYQILAGHGDAVLSLCVLHTSCGPILASGSRDTTVRLWAPSKGLCLSVLQTDNSAVNSLSVSDNVRDLASFEALSS